MSSKTQEGVPDLIAELYKANLEVVQPSAGPPEIVERDPHLRLRRTLTPASPISGLKKHKDAQFMIQGSTGKRIQLTFSALDHSFHMDAYEWGASEEEAEQRIVTLHGVSPGVSRTRWHSLGERISKTMPKTRFVALDWHSIDRTDEYQNEFLTMLPKHIFSVPSDTAVQEFIDLYPEEQQEWIRDFLEQVRECCPRSTKEGAATLRAVIKDGLGWGVQGKSFILGVKSWSGGIGTAMLAEEARRDDSSFRKQVEAVIIMHPACLLEKDECARAVDGIPTLLCWAKDDADIPYQFSSRFLVHDKVKLITYEIGGHANFDGSNDLPNFDDEIMAWLRTRN